jgi:hypothetical protein
MNHRRRAALAVLLAVLAVGCGPATSSRPGASPAAAEHRFRHVHEFPSIGKRIAPPTGHG